MDMAPGFIVFFACVALMIAAKSTNSYLEFKDTKRVHLTANLSQKLFMTAWLGLCFASFFLILCVLLSRFIKKESFLATFTYGKENPAIFFYLAGTLFSSVTLLVYLVRMVAKRVYRRLQRQNRP